MVAQPLIDQSLFLPLRQAGCRQRLEHLQRIIRKNNTENDDFDIFQILKLEDCTVEDEIVEGQIHEDLRALVELLPQEQREVVKMRHFMGMSFKDIADSSDVSINTALGRMRYALINLRKMIKENDIMLTVS